MPKKDKTMIIFLDIFSPTQFLIRLLEMVLFYNTFEFNYDLYKQCIGLSMGTKAAPNVANLDMESRERRVLSSNNQHTLRIYKSVWKRFIDYILMLFQGTKQQLIEFIDWLNSLFPSIKFTASYNFEERKVEFLDVLVRIDEYGAIKTDLYRKKMVINSYLLPKSCHSPHITKNIPYSLALRIKRMCSENATFETRANELKHRLRERGYSMASISQAIERVKFFR